MHKAGSGGTECAAAQPSPTAQHQALHISHYPLASNMGSDSSVSAGSRCLPMSCDRSDSSSHDMCYMCSAHPSVPMSDLRIKRGHMVS
jgi:hypothetical protein